MRFVIYFVCAVLILGMAGCSAGQVEKPKLESLKQAYKDEGFEVGDNETLAYEMLNAKAGIKFKLNGELIELYEYDTNNLVGDAAETVEQAKSGSVSMSGFNIPVVYKDGLMIARHDEHSKKDEVLKVFNDF